MANSADKERVASDMRPADFRGAVKIIRDVIGKKKDKIAGVNSEINNAWKTVENDKKVGKAAGKIFTTLDAMDEDARRDTLRDLNGLCDAADWPVEEQDLVDQAEDNVVSMRVGPTPSRGDDDDDENGDDDQEGEKSTAADRTNEFVRKLGAKPGTMAPDALDDAFDETPRLQ